LQYVQKIFNQHQRVLLQKELMWVGCHKWKLQDINFMILTGSEKTVYSFERQRNEYHSSRVWVNQMMIKPTAARKKLL
jgi:hypothetical protein